MEEDEDFNELIHGSPVRVQEATACLILEAARLDSLKRESIDERLGQLRTLTGISKLHKFTLLASQLWQELNSYNTSPALRATFDEGLKSLEALLDSKEYAAMYSRQLIEELNWEDEVEMDDKSLWTAIQNMINHEEYAYRLLELAKQTGLDVATERISGGLITERDLVNKILTLDLTMSELRLLQISVEVITTHDVSAAPEAPKDPPFELPKPRPYVGQED